MDENELDELQICILTGITIVTVGSIDLTDKIFVHNSMGSIRAIQTYRFVEQLTKYAKQLSIYIYIYMNIDS